MRSLRAVPVFLAVAAGLHLAVLPAHLEEGAAIGAFFAVVALGQLGAAIAVQRGVGSWTRAVIAVANVGVIVVWAVSRTAGLALGGHDAAPEPIGLLDSLSLVAEMAAVAGLYVATRPARFRSRFAVPALAALALVAAAIAFPLAPAADAHEHVHSDDAFTAPAHHHSGH